jgi:predicted transposase/invertase (TIGR01784 family)
MNTLSSLTGAEIRRLAKQNAAAGKLLNPLMDVVFKTLFSGDNDDSRQALRSLLSACTGRNVTDVKVLNCEIQPEHLGAKTVRMDMHVTFDGDSMAGLEMQFGSGNDDQKLRAAFGVSRLLSGQGRGRKYRELKRVYQIFFVNGVLFPQNDRVPRRYFLMEEQDHDILTSVMEVIFYELPKLDAKVRAYGEGKKDLKGFSKEEQWCIYLKYRHEEKAAGLINELCRKETGIMRAEAVLQRVSRDEEEWARQLFREKAAMDYRSGMGAARDEGFAMGRNEGFTRGRDKGIAIGYDQARLEYEAKAERDKLEIARNLLNKGWTVEDAAQIAKLPLEKVCGLK